MLTVTLKAIREHDPCIASWTKLLRHLGKTQADDTAVPLVDILGLLGLRDALWALRALPPEMDSQVRLLACDFASGVLQYTDDPRPAEAIAVARRYAVGEATAEELAAARGAARDAAKAAPWGAARDAARAASWDAAEPAARDAARVAGKVGGAGVTADWDAAWDAAWAKQEAIFRDWLTGQE